MTATVIDIAPSGAALGATVDGLDLHQPLDEDHIPHDLTRRSSNTKC